jgi:hypothetical protein
VPEEHDGARLPLEDQPGIILRIGGDGGKAQGQHKEKKKAAHHAWCYVRRAFRFS